MERKKIVLSGASSGIGRSLAICLDKAGHQVLALARNEKALEDLAKQCKSLVYLAVDLSTDDSKEVYQKKLSDWNHIDALINNAGQLINKPFMQTSTKDFNALWEANTLSAVRLIQWSYEKLKQAGNSHVLNISSMGGYMGSSKFPGLAAYSSSKGALSILSESLAEEFKDDGIRVNALALGAVQTDMLQKAFPGYAAPLKAEEMAAYIAQFIIEGSKVFNGRVLPVTLGNP